MKRILAIAGKELRDLMRERSIILAFATQAFVAAFSGFLTFGLVGLYDPGTVGARPDLDVAYVGPGDFLDRLREAGINVELAPNLDGALAAFAAGDADIVVEETIPNATATRTVTLLLGEGELETTLAVTRIKDLLREYERDLRLERAQNLTTPVLYLQGPRDANPYFGFSYAVLLPLLVFTPVFLAAATTADSLVHEITSRTILLLRSAPVRTFEIVAGKLLVPALLVPAQVLLWVGLLALNGLSIAHLGLLLVFAAGLAVAVASLTSAVAGLAGREAPAQASYTLVLLALVPVAALLPRDPFNVVARLGAGSMDTASYVTIGVCLALGVVAFTGAAWVVGRRLRIAGD